MRTRTRTRLVRMLIAGIAFLILFYGLWQARGLLFGPRITITEPQDGATIASESVTITGTAANTQELYINDTLIRITEDGSFAKKLLIAPGYSILEVVAIDRFGSAETTYLNLWRDTALPQPPLSATGTPVVEHGSQQNGPALRRGSPNQDESGTGQAGQATTTNSTSTQ